MSDETPSGQAQTPKKKGGRPPKLTEEIIAVVVSELLRGNWFSSACRRAGISRETGYTWREEGRTARRGSLLRRFSDAVEQADVQAELSAVDVVHGAVKDKSLKAAQFLLTRRFWKRWGQKRATTVTAKGGLSHRHEHRHTGAIAHGVIILPPEDQGEESLSVDVALERAGLGDRLAAARNGQTYVPPSAPIGPQAGSYEGVSRVDAEEPADPTGSRPWRPGPRRDPSALLKRLSARAGAEPTRLEDDEDAA